MPAYLCLIANKWSRSASRLYLARFDIGIEAWRIMALLAIEGQLTANRIVTFIHMDKASVSRNLRSMHLAGLIALQNDPRDARQRFVMLTEKGVATHDKILTLAIAREKRLVSCLDDQERGTLLTLLERVHGNLSVLDEEEEFTGEEAQENLESDPS